MNAPLPPARLVGFFIPLIVGAGLLADQSWYQHLPWWARIARPHR